MKNIEYILNKISNFANDDDINKFNDLKKLIDEFALEQGLDTSDEEGTTLLHRASADGFINIVEYLLELDATIDVEDNEGRTPIDMATLHKKTNVIKLLQEMHKKIDFRNSQEHMKFSNPYFEHNTNVSVSNNNIYTEKDIEYEVLQFKNQNTSPIFLNIYDISDDLKKIKSEIDDILNEDTDKIKFEQTIKAIHNDKKRKYDYTFSAENDKNQSKRFKR